VAVDIMHRFSVELCAMLDRMFAACWKRPVIAFPVIQMMIYVPVKVL
jgi:hypothetical protein